MKKEDSLKPYDPKKSCWVPNTNKAEGGYLEGLTEKEMKVADSMGRIHRSMRERLVGNAGQLNR